ncbi:putative N-acetyltransferase YnaD [Halomicronema hongdechloris C2206]|uniref:N-acetyltransferase YnaD n=1 Tax=Halomicronema hongdechloris C2206 TaxID=1641165 RepID=A0A1Z3HHM4_9CYAN|nr:GNAT family N-acetyltransferase [Halomicronema hongdechloris]ASC69794.1 putative N-acetyltransferase YnaD [Halomicronema hongdechloris C2206]
MWIETQRLVLRDFQRKDLPALARILANPEVMKFSPTGILSAAQTQAKIEQFMISYQAVGFGKWAVMLRSNHTLIGYCGIAIETIDGQEQPELGYRLDPTIWGQGLATEAAGAALDDGFHRCQLPYLLGLVERANTASVRVLQKLGMSYVKETLFYGLQMDLYRLNR